MKTMQMTIVLTISLLIPALGFTQVHLRTTTQAFTRTALTTNSIKPRPVVTSTIQSANTIEITESAHTNVPAAAEMKTETAVEKTTAVKARAEAKSDVTAAKQKVTNVKPKTNASVSGDVKAGTKASVSNN